MKILIVSPEDLIAGAGVESHNLYKLLKAHHEDVRWLFMIRR